MQNLRARKDQVQTCFENKGSKAWRSQGTRPGLCSRQGYAELDPVSPESPRRVPAASTVSRWPSGGAICSCRVDVSSPLGRQTTGHQVSTEVPLRHPRKRKHAEQNARSLQRVFGCHVPAVPGSPPATYIKQQQRFHSGKKSKWFPQHRRGKKNPSCPASTITVATQLYRASRKLLGSRLAEPERPASGWF